MLMLKVFRGWMIFIFLVLLTPINWAQADEIVYFSQINEDNQYQLVKLINSEEINPIFDAENDGLFKSVSPNAEFIAFTKFYTDDDVTNELLWLGNLSTQEQKIIGNLDARSVTTIWSGDSHFLVVQELLAIVPLSQGYNYGRISVYDVQNDNLFVLDTISGFPIDLLPDNQNLLLWNEINGYILLNIHDYSVVELSSSILGNQQFSDGDVAHTSPIFATVRDGFPSIFEINDENLIELQTIDIEGANQLKWSPDDTILSIVLDNNDIVLWDYHTASTIGTISNPVNDTPSGYYYDIRWAEDTSRLLILVNRSGNIEIYEYDIELAQMTQLI